MEDRPRASASGRSNAVNNTLEGRFQLREQIAKGISGGVYRATDLQNGSQVAIKLLFAPPSAGRNFGLRFRQEFDVMSQLRHPNCVQVIHHGVTDDDILYFAMEYVHGRTLKQIVQESGPLSPESVAFYLDQVASALDAAHLREIIHRDVNPSNIMIQVDDAGNHSVKLLDFGLAKVLHPDNEDSVPVTGRLRMGTVLYMSPEQVEGKAVTKLWDVYALGVTVYYALTGVLPFERKTEMATLTAVLEEPIPPFSQTNPDLRVPPAAEEVVRHAMARKPNQRFQSAGDMARKFREALGYHDRVPAPKGPIGSGTRPAQRGDVRSGTHQSQPADNTQRAGSPPRTGAHSAPAPIPSPPVAPDEPDSANLTWVIIIVTAIAVVAIALYFVL